MKVMGMMPACTIPSSGLALSSHFHLQNRTCLPGSSGIAGPERTPASRPAPVLGNCLCLRTVILTSLLACSGTMNLPYALMVSICSKGSAPVLSFSQSKPFSGFLSPANKTQTS